MFWFGVFTIWVTAAGSAFGQTQPAVAAPSGPPVTTSDDGPPPPESPEVIRRDAEGRASIRAVRISTPLRVDGVLDEAVYAGTRSIDGFVQQEPREGEPTTERTEVWIFFDDRNIYVAARCHDSHPERMVVNEMRRDNMNIYQNENFTVAFDTFHDKRNGYYFQVNAIGGLRDALVTDERDSNFDWNTVWDAKAARTDQGWTVEMVIPFKSLRYTAGREQTWGVNLRRTIKWKNEETFVTPMPASYGMFGVFKFSSAATLVGLEAPVTSRNLELKPYAISDVATDRTATPAVSNDLGGDFGFDAKYGLSRSLIADFTYNTDFAQVEADEQQVNLTRFSLLYPEKREFFLEGQGIFAFGGVAAHADFGGGGAAVGSGQTQASSLAPVLFFSRRIGLEKKDEQSPTVLVPITAGGRVTGRVGQYTLGLLSIGTEQSDRASTQATNFSVVRVRRDILRRSAIGFIGLNRSPRANGTSSNQTFGVDANLAFFQNVGIKGYYAKTRTPGLSGNDASYLGQFAYNADRYGFVYQHLTIGEHFNPEVGFMSRSDIRRHYTGVRFSPRPKASKAVRRLYYEASLDYIANGDSRLETRTGQASFATEFQSSDRFQVVYLNNYEYLARPFRIASNVTIPVGAYEFQSVRTTYMLGNQRRVAGMVSATSGTFYDGTMTAVSYALGRVEITHQFVVEPRLSLNFVDLPGGSFTNTVAGARTTYTFTPRTFVSALLQYNSSTHAATANIRFRWEYQPGSDLFVVYSEGRDTDVHGYPMLQNRGFVVKVTRLFRY